MTLCNCRPSPRSWSTRAILAQLLSLNVYQALAQQSQPSPCIRWAHSSTLGISSTNNSALSTLYIYGGDAKLSPDQPTGTRTNALVALDVSRDWSIANPPLSLVAGDNGDSYSPPATSLGAMWGNAAGDRLFYYGGYFSETPHVDPDPQRLFQYDIKSRRWTPVDARGSVERVAEGAAAVIPGQGDKQPVFNYFGGHLDSYTVAGWSNQTPRVYLNSMIDFDIASSTWTNHSTYANAGRTSPNSTIETSPLLRADNTLTFVPGMGTDSKGVLVSIGGGNQNQLVDNTIIDVFDIGAGGWVRQATQGDIMTPRVSHCAVRGSAKVNGQLQHQIFVYGGQASNRTTQIISGQNSDMYVLSLPSFTWTLVGKDLPSQPTGRAAHTCTLLGSQMIVVGGFVSEDLICESPGVYVFDTAQLAWTTQYTAGTLYTTPNDTAIASLAGGRGTGSSVSGSGYAFGDGQNDPDTSGSFQHTPTDGGNSGSGKSNTGAIAGGVVGGVLGGLLLAGIAFWLYRRRQSQQHSQEATEKAALAGSAGSSPGSLGSQRDPFAAAVAGRDDVEETMQGYNAQFSHLVPRSTLRVVNA